MTATLGVRHETKSRWERRSPIPPDLARHLIGDHGLRLVVQSSSTRVFTDAEYQTAGAEVRSSLDGVPVVLGVKEIPPALLAPSTAYLFFSHVIKGQPGNMPMLRRLLELGCTLVDYERITAEDGRRLVFFGRFAGLAGMVDVLWSLGRRLRAEGVPSPFDDLKPTHAYHGLDEALEAVRDAGRRIAEEGLPPELTPLVIGVAGYGNVARGAQEVLSRLPATEVEPRELPGLDRAATGHSVYRVTFREEHLVERAEPGRPFALEEYYRHPERYRSVFARWLPHLDVLVNATYWDARYPRLVTFADLLELSDPGPMRMRVIGDLGCDVGGAVECTLEATDPGDPVYVVDPTTRALRFGFDGPGPVVLAVDILPSELPRDASAEFAQALAPYLPAVATADYDVPFHRLELPPPIRRAVIVHRGELTPEYRYLEGHL